MSSTAETKTDTAKTGELVTKQAATVATSPSTSSELDQWMHSAHEADTDPDAGAYGRIIAQVLSAKSPDIVLTPVAALEAKDMIGVPLILYGFDLNESEFDEGSPFYASMQCAVAQDGTPVIINCGHKKVIAQLVKLREFDQWPYNVMFEARGKSRVGGTDMLGLIKWEQETEKPPF